MRSLGVSSHTTIERGRVRGEARRGIARRRLLFAIAGSVVVIGAVLTAVLGGRGAVGYAAGVGSVAGGAKAVQAGAPMGDWAVASLQSFDITTLGTGQLEAKKQTEFRNTLEYEASILEIMKEGQSVQPGDVLVRLNTELVQKQLDQENLALESARAEVISAEQAYEIQVNENESGIRKATLAVELAELDLKKWAEGEVKSRRQTLTQQEDEQTREVERLREKVSQDERLLGKGFMSKDEAQRNQIELRRAETALAKAKLDREVFEQFEMPKDERTRTSTLEEARSELERTRRKNESHLASRLADRENKRKQLTLREAAITKLKTDIASAVMKSETAGLVVYATSLRPSWYSSQQGPLQVGRKISPNELILAIPDTTELLASVRVGESIAAKVVAGQPATLRADALVGLTIRGTVQSVGVLAEQGGWDESNVREYAVKILLDKDYDSRLKPSMRVEAEIRLDRAENLLSVPMQAVFAEGPVRYVITRRDGAMRRVPVKIEKRSDRLAAISAGLREGERVLVRQPTAGEVAASAWGAEELREVGLMIGADGAVVPLAAGDAEGKLKAAR